MDKEALAEMMKEVVGDLLEAHLASVHEEISDLRTDMNGLDTRMTGGFKDIRKETRDGFVGLKNEIGAVHNRIDNETFALNDLEYRTRKVLPKLPEAAKQ
jgi:hypothetical protein